MDWGHGGPPVQLSHVAVQLTHWHLSLNVAFSTTKRLLSTLQLWKTNEILYNDDY